MSSQATSKTLMVQGVEVPFFSGERHKDCVSLTDIARYKSATPKDVIKNWMRSREVIEYLGLWEQLHNPVFKGIEFDAFKQEAGRNAQCETTWFPTSSSSKACCNMSGSSL